MVSWAIRKIPNFMLYNIFLAGTIVNEKLTYITLISMFKH